MQELAELNAALAVQPQLSGDADAVNSYSDVGKDRLDLQEGRNANSQTKNFRRRNILS
jgi:hypothetical protein